MFDSLKTYSPSEEAALVWLWWSSEPSPAGKSSSRESTSQWPDMEEMERCGLPTQWGEISLSRGEWETQGGEGDGESTEGLKWAWAWPVNRKGEPRREGEVGERGGAVVEDSEGETAAAGGGVEWTFWPLFFITCKRRTVLFWTEGRIKKKRLQSLQCIKILKAFMI